MIRARPGGLSGFDECSSAPGCLSHSPPWSSNPTSSYTLRGCFGGDLVFSGSSARKCFPQKSFVWGKGGVCHDFDSRPYKKCAHFAHFSETPCRVTRGLRTGGHSRPPTGAPQGALYGSLRRGTPEAPTCRWPAPKARRATLHHYFRVG